MDKRTRLLKKIEAFQEMCIKFATGTRTTYDEYERSRMAFLTDPELISVMPDWIISCGYGSQYWTFIKSISSSYEGRRKFLNSEFNQLIQFVENGEYEAVAYSFDKTVKVFNEENINNLWKKIHLRKKTDPEGAITAAKSLLEASIKHILEKLGKQYDETDELPKLYKNLMKELHVSEIETFDQTNKQIFSGTTSVVNGISTLRNKLGDAHGSGKNIQMLNDNYVELTINLACSMTVFLIGMYLSLQKTKAV